MTHISRSEAVLLGSQYAADTSSGEDQGPLGIVEDVEISSAGRDGDDDISSKSTPEEGGGEGSEIVLMVVYIDANAGPLASPPKCSMLHSQPEMHDPFRSLKAAFDGLATSRKMLVTPEDSDSDGQQPARRSGKRRGWSSKSTSPPTYTPKTPESSSDIERVLLRPPNSSYLWIRYMSFQLQLSGIDEAREIAKRVLITISSREEAEILNVWTALLNLKNVYSTEESLEIIFKDTVRH
ncbi:hypothetical protein BJY52DRAFT_1217389 [Lactarius psammicola]|nr:hypothetical protein BJY52DRAFT_1217389 [Lactarius psammicola]